MAKVESSLPVGSSIGYTPENVANKATDFSVINDIKYPSTEAVKEYVDSKISSDYTKAVYFNSTTPIGATIFDTNNPPTINDNSLKEDDTNLYIGTNSSTWVWNSETLVYETETVSDISNFFRNGSLVPAGNSKDEPINRPAPISVMEYGVSGASIFKSGFSWWKWIPSHVSGRILFDNVTQSYDTQFPNKIGGEVQTISMLSDHLPKIQFTGDGIQTDFDLETNAKVKAVFLEGALLDDANWSQVDNILTLTFAVALDERIKPI